MRAYATHQGDDLALALGERAEAVGLEELAGGDVGRGLLVNGCCHDGYFDLQAVAQHYGPTQQLSGGATMTVIEKQPYIHPDGRTCIWDADDIARYPVGSDVKCDRNHT